jgi:hypothetical protein
MMIQTILKTSFMKEISFIIILCLTASCTMTKRVHNPGWHVEWRLKNLKTQVFENENNLDESAVFSSQKVEENYVNPEEPISQTLLTTNQPRVSKLSDDEQVMPLGQNDFSKAVSLPSRESSKEKSVSQEPRVEGDKRNLALISLYFLVSAIVFPSVALMICDMGWGAVAIVSGFIGALSIFAALILSIIALIRIYKNVDQRSNKKIAWTVAIVSLVFLLPILVILFLVFYAC